MNLILASQSSIRRDLLKNAGLDFQVIPADIDESPHGAPFVRALALAGGKAQKISAEHPQSFVIGADQVGVLCDSQKELLKPENALEAQQQLEQMSGKAHVFRSVACLWHQSQSLAEVFEEATVTFRQLTPADIQWYIDTGEWKGCCGGYRIEAQGLQLVEKIQGSLMAIYGLPLIPLIAALRMNGILQR